MAKRAAKNKRKPPPKPGPKPRNFVRAEAMPWKLERCSANVHRLVCDVGGPGWEQWFLLMSDEHWDNPHCQRDLLARHHKEAVARRAPILKFGDTFCAMQGKFDKRSNKDDLRPEHLHGDYLDSLVATAADWYQPFASNIAVIGYGNHETSINDRHGSDLVARLCERLQTRGGITQSGGYSGWVRLAFQLRVNQAIKQTSLALKYHHGAGGGGPVTKGLIDFNRMAEWTDADIFCAGHVHWKNYTPVKRVRLTQNNKEECGTMRYLRLGTYKDEYASGVKGFHNEKGRGPRPLGGFWLRVTWPLRKECAIKCDVIEAGE